MMRTLLERHPYIEARDAFLAGRITISQAAGMVAIDRDWIAECDLCGQCPKERASELVRNVWRGDLVAAIQQAKRNASAGVTGA
jgi:hypothetical protein